MSIRRGDRTEPRGRRRRAGLVAAVTALGLLASSCSTGPRGGGETMHFQVLEGSATLTRDAVPSPVRGEVRVQAGDRVAVGRGGVAELRLERGRTFELSGATVEIVSGRELALTAGSLLAGVTSPAKVQAGPVAVAGSRGAFRVERGVSIRVAVYAGSVTFSGGGEPLPIPAYREVVVAGGVVPRGVRPLHIDPADRWDRRFLQEAIDLDGRLANLGRGLESQLGAATGPAFFQLVMPAGFDTGFLAPFLSFRRSDLLIGLVVAAEAARKGGAGLEATFSKIFALWSEGGSWGLIALEHGVAQPSLFERLLDAIRRTGIISEGRGPASRPPAPAPSPSPSPAPTGGTSPSPAPTGGTPSPSPTPTQPPVTGPVQGVVDDLVKSLPLPPAPTGGTPSPSPSPSPTPTQPPVTEPVQQVVDDLVDDLVTALPLPPIG